MSASTPKKIISSDEETLRVDSEEDIDNLLNTNRIKRIDSSLSMSYSRPAPEPTNRSSGMSDHRSAMPQTAYNHPSDPDDEYISEHKTMPSAHDSRNEFAKSLRSEHTTELPAAEPVSEWRPESTSTLSNREVSKRKAELLSRARKYKKDRGVEFNIPLSMNTPLDELEAEVQRVEDDQNIMNATTVGRNLIVSSITLLEFLNGKYNPFDLYLDGWSVDVKEKSDNNEFDDPIKKIYEKYKDKAQMAPEVQLLLALGTSAVMCHFKKTLFQPKIAGLRDTVRQCPDIISQQPAYQPNTHQQTQQGVMSGPPSDVDEMIRNMMKDNPATLPRDPAQGAHLRNPDASASLALKQPVDSDSDISTDSSDSPSEYDTDSDTKSLVNTARAGRGRKY